MTSMRLAPTSLRELGHLRRVQIVRGREAVEPEVEAGSAAVSAFAAFRLKSPISGGCDFRAAHAAGRRSGPGWGSRRLSRKSTMRASPGLRTRGLATRAAMPLGFDALDRRAQAVQIEVIERDAGRAQLDAPRRVCSAVRTSRCSCSVRAVRRPACGAICAARRTSRGSRIVAHAELRLSGLQIARRLPGAVDSTASRRERRAVASSASSAQFVRRVAQAAELLAQVFHA